MRAVRGERGAVTAEFAVTLPAVLIVLSLVIGGILLATHRLTLTSAAADVARLEARGDEAAASARLAELPPGVGVARTRTGQLHCVSLRANPVRGPLAFIGVSATSCAAVSGEGPLHASASADYRPENGADGGRLERTILSGGGP